MLIKNPSLTEGFFINEIESVNCALFYKYDFIY